MTFFTKYRRLIVSVLFISVLILVGRFVSNIDFRMLRRYLNEMPGMFALVIGSSFVAYLFSTIGWRLCMGADGHKITLVEAFRIRHVGEMLGTFNPTSVIAGDTFKISLLSKSGLSTENSVSSILLMRMINLFSSILLMTISIIYLTFGRFGHEDELLLFLMIAVMGALCVLLAKYFLNEKLYLGKTVEKIREKTKWTFLTPKIVESCYETNTIAARYFRTNKSKFTLAFVLIALHWMLGALEFFIVLKTLGMEVSFIDAVSVEMGVIIFKSLGTIIPGQLGVEEYGNKVLLDVIGINSNEIWLIVSLVRRSRQLFWLAMAGVFLIIITKKSYKTA
ncbi:MAG: hypothetical protein BWZ06_01603 [Bacteroidetes bacterium ADurb.BinA261]|nr:MAG: hypothetical protein BWZ06_01603 [Bacteroidetes bacterium ADurb.BinA261]